MPRRNARHFSLAHTRKFMAKILNIDTLVESEERELQFKGKTYKVQDMSVDDFIEASRVAEKIEAGGMSFAEQMEASIGLISRGIPDIDVAELRKLKLPQLMAISQFVRGVDPEDIRRAVKSVRETEGTVGAQGESQGESGNVGEGK
jgi:hypothetical protein